MTIRSFEHSHIDAYIASQPRCTKFNRVLQLYCEIRDKGEPLTDTRRPIKVEHKIYYQTSKL